MRVFLAVLSLVVFVGLVQAIDDEAKKDLERMQGEWVMVAGEFQGQPFPEKLVKSAKRVVKDDTYIVTGESDEGAINIKGKFKLDPSHKPAHIDATTTSDGGAESKLLGIYAFKDDELHICMDSAEKGRPKEFSSSQGTFITWKRAKK